MTRTNRTAANQRRQLDQQWVAEGHQVLVAWFSNQPDMAARELPELEELVTAVTESGQSPTAALLGMAVLVTDTTIRLADPATLDPVTGRLDRAAVEGYLAALDHWIGPPLDGIDRKPVTRTRDLFGNEIGRAHRIEERPQHRAASGRPLARLRAGAGQRTRPPRLLSTHSDQSRTTVTASWPRRANKQVTERWPPEPGQCRGRSGRRLGRRGDRSRGTCAGRSAGHRLARVTT